MFKKIISFIIFILFATLPNFVAKAESQFTPTFDITSKSAYFVNLDTNTVVFQKDINARRLPASLTKIMTCLLVFENVKDLNETFTSNYDDYPAEIHGTSTADIRIGETLTIDQLINCAMVQSANEACNILARRVSGNIANFVALMNKRAKELGCKDTVFANPTGLQNDNHYTTAYDMYLITKEAMKYPHFMEIAALSRYPIPQTNKNIPRVLVTTNLMIDSVNGGNLYYKYAKGIKAGRVDVNDRSVISVATKSGFSYLCIMMGGGTSGAGEDLSMLESKHLYEWAFSNISFKQVASANDPIAQVPVTLAWNTTIVLLTPQKDLFALFPNNVDIGTIKKDVKLKNSVQAPIKKGQVLGDVTFLYNNNVLGTMPLVASQDVARSTPLYYAYVLQNFVNSIWFKVVVGLIIALLIAYFILIIIRDNKQHKVRKVKKVKYRRKI
jgi:D-alanyl-D-alanine carboxypeptidase (penicillin-binding protein 5/6)